MQHRKWLAAALVATSLSVSACTGRSNLGEASDQAAQVEPAEKTGVSRVTLTPAAAARLGIKTEAVRAAPAAIHTAGAVNGNVKATAKGTAPAEVIPYAAILYDKNGNTSTYTSTGPLTFVRRHVVIDHIDGDLAFLRDGPVPGTAIVTVGAMELLGAEYGVGGE